ncbi:MAG: hypothetical protein FWG10_14645, partial [Eubacteriaceae bacterium]|nr:hypothetical protein [Eubacteriaceae bacterium]
IHWRSFGERGNRAPLRQKAGHRSFFKVAKSCLGLAKEFSCRPFDSLAACAAIVFLRYMMLAEAQRDSSDPRTIGGLFILFCDEARDTAFQEVLSGLMRYLEDFLRKQLPYNNTYLDEIIGRFFDGLPDGLRFQLNY